MPVDAETQAALDALADRIDTLMDEREELRKRIEDVQKQELVAPQDVSVTLESGTNEVAHGLGRRPLGYILGPQSAAVDIYQTGADASATTDKVLGISASGATDAVIKVY